MNKRRILIVDDDANSRVSLARKLAANEYEVMTAVDAKRANIGKFDLIISQTSGKRAKDRIKTFHLNAANFVRRETDKGELRAIIEQMLDEKSRSGREEKSNGVEEHIEFELPSDVGLMHGVLNFVVARVVARGIVEADDAHLFIALDEAFVNAVKHGNRHDMRKLVRFSVDINDEQARFTIEDEGEGFDPRAVPDPRTPENIFKTSGRGVLLIENIMDEIEYNARGNRLMMIKHKTQPSNLESQIPVSKSQGKRNHARDEESFANRS